MTTTTELLTFHGDHDLKAKLLERIGAHEKADAIAQGTYEIWGLDGAVHRCAVGCSLRDLSDRKDVPSDWHAEMERALGVPRWLASLEDSVFERMSPDDAMAWPRRFSEALPVGVSLNGLADQLAIRRLREECLSLSGQWPESIKTQVVVAIEQTIAALENKEDDQLRSAARSAAWSAESAARSAAWSAESAARSAESAARSAARSAAASAAWSAARSAAASAAWSAESAARSAAWSAAYKRESDRIIEELKKLALESERR